MAPVFDDYNVEVLGATLLLDRDGTLVWVGRDNPAVAIDSLEGQSLTKTVASLVE